MKWSAGRGILIVSVLSACEVGFACTSGPDSTSAGSDAASVDSEAALFDGGALGHDGDSNYDDASYVPPPDGEAGAPACIADGVACSQQDEESRCCGRFCAVYACASANVDFVGSCPSTCGGNPEGAWHLVGGCGPAICDGGAGAVIASSGALTISTTGTDIFSYAYSFHCDGLSRGTNAFTARWSPDAGTVGGLPYCVVGDTLWIMQNISPGPGTMAYRFTK
jgi:hypothetical protein